MIDMLVHVSTTWVQQENNMTSQCLRVLKKSYPASMSLWSQNHAALAHVRYYDSVLLMSRFDRSENTDVYVGAYGVVLMPRLLPFELGINWR